MRPNAFKRFLPEDFDGTDGLGAGLARDLFADLEMNAILPDLFRGDQVGRLIVELTELTDAGVIRLFGATTDGEEF